MEEVLLSKIVFECPIFRVEETVVKLPNGARDHRWYVVKTDSVGIIPIDSEGRVLLTKEYMSAVGEACWRIPAGRIQDGEDPATAARRELREEIGLNCKELQLILETKCPSGLIKQKWYFYLAKNLFSAPLESGEWEDIEVIPKQPEEVIELICAGEVHGNIARALVEAIRRDTSDHVKPDHQNLADDR